MMPTDRPQRRRVIAGVALSGALALAACSFAGDEPPAAGQAPDTVVARFAPGGEVSVIEVSVDDPRPLRRAELVGPGGVIVPADSIDAGSAPSLQDRVFQQSAPERPFAPPPNEPGSGNTGGVGIGGGFGFGMGAGLPMPLTGAEGNGGQLPDPGQVHSTALLRLPDPLGYRLEWQQWQVRVQVGDPPNANIVVLPAPQPPASL
ncbi:MAG: hypothetical protein JWL84_1330 [Rhodospirillales bacterium]|jgi:hypothetical protein|nr:hypothetical protein [Rhodospirillales bacterium]